jgi:hypothetical protein
MSTEDASELTTNTQEESLATDDFDITQALKEAVRARKANKVVGQESVEGEVEERAPEGRENKPGKKVNLDIFEVHELSGGFFVTFSDKFNSILEDDLGEFHDLNRQISVFRTDRPELLTPEIYERAAKICQQHLGISYEDLIILQGAIRDCLMDARKKGTTEYVLGQLQTIFLPKPQIDFKVSGEPKYVGRNRLVELLAGD